MKSISLSKLQKLDARKLQQTLAEEGGVLSVASHQGIVAVILTPQLYENMKQMCSRLDNLVELLYETERKLKGDKNEKPNIQAGG